MNKKIRVTLTTGFDSRFKEETPSGVIWGREITEEALLSQEEAQELLQDYLQKMDYADALNFCDKYKKR
jgi:hypothetical protein